MKNACFCIIICTKMFKQTKMHGCLNIFNHSNRHPCNLDKCGHSICYSCVQTIQISQKLCPECRTPFLIAKKNYLALSMQQPIYETEQDTLLNAIDFKIKEHDKLIDQHITNFNLLKTTVKYYTTNCEVNPDPIELERIHKQLIEHNCGLNELTATVRNLDSQIRLGNLFEVEKN